MPQSIVKREYSNNPKFNRGAFKNEKEYISKL